MKPCWHCSDSKRCDCMVCAGDFKFGPCQACKGAEAMRELGPILDAHGIDIRDSANWEMYKGELHFAEPAHRRLKFTAPLPKQGKRKRVA